MSGTGPGEIAVLDVGKTNARLSATDAQGRVIESVSTPNRVLPGPPWRRHDLRGLGEWAMANLADLARRHPIAHVVPTGHGSGGVLAQADPDAGGDGAALPMIDYEDRTPPEIDAAYRPLTGDFLDRGSGIMFASTHAGRQLYRMQVERPDAVASTRWRLSVAQYWAWRLSGVAASEFSGLGAQSHFWNTPDWRWFPLVRSQGWLRLMPPFRAAWERLGPIRPELARRHGLSRDIAVHTGAHDSSTNFYRYQAAGLSGFTLVSTGAWLVAMSDSADLARADEARGMTCNADVAGRPIGGARAMGGREFSAIAGPDWRAAKAGAGAVARLVARGTLALPSFGDDHGQFPGTARKGRILGPPPEDPDARRSLAVLHAALITVECASCLNGGRRLLLDGVYPSEPLYAPLVAALWPGATETTDEAEGVTVGAALLVGHAARRAPAPAALTPVEPLRLPGLSDYAARWRVLARAAAST